MLGSLPWPVTALICRVSTLLSEDRIVTVVALREWLVGYGKIPALSVIFRIMFSKDLWPKTFLSNQILSFSGSNLKEISSGRWNKASTSGWRWERYALTVWSRHLDGLGASKYFPVCVISRAVKITRVVLGGKHRSGFVFIQLKIFFPGGCHS